MGLKTSKFGGSSVADAAQIRKVEAIVRRDPDRRVVVVSAPGKRSTSVAKITDLLYRCHALAVDGKSFDAVYASIADRYREIARDLQLSLDLEPELERIRSRIATSKTADYPASRGEYLCAKIVAAALNCEFLDAAELIRFEH